MRRPVFFSAAVAAILLGCNAILGVESAEFDPPAAPIDSSTVDATESEAPGVDAKADAVDAAEEADATIEASVDAAEEDSGVDACATADLAGDPRNCGRCGHDCLGGACTAGVCQPWTVSDEPTSAVGSIAIGATNLFWASVTDGAIRQAPLTGGPPTIFYTTGAIDATSDVVAPGDGFVYFTDAFSGAIERCPESGCSTAGPESVIFDVNPAVSIAVEGTTLVVAEVDKNVFRCDIPCAAVTELSAGENHPTRIAIRGGFITWITLNTSGSEVRVYGPTDSGPHTLSNSGAFSAVTLTDTEIILAKLSGEIDAIAQTGPASGRTIARPSSPDALFIDGNQVLFNDQTSGTIQRTALDGTGLPALVAQQQDAPHAVAATATAYYWVNSRSLPAKGNVMAVAK